jgi:hypothetical protein
MQQTTPVDTKALMVDPAFRTVIGANSADPFPMLDRSWDIFSAKGIRTVQAGKAPMEFRIVVPA